MAEGRTLVLRVFTHPACAGCTTAVREAWSVGRRHPEIAVRTVSLENKEGLSEARGEGVQTIPTLILASGGEELERWIGTPAAGVLTAAVERLGVDGASQGGS